MIQGKFKIIKNLLGIFIYSTVYIRKPQDRPAELQALENFNKYSVLQMI